MKEYIPMVITFFCSILGAIGQLLFKIGSNPFNPFKLGIGLVCYGFATILFVGALKFGELSKLYPIIAFSYIWVMILSWKVLNEPVGLWQWIGACGIVISVGLIVK